MLKSTELKEFAKSIGADLVGIAPESRFESAPARHRPYDYLENCKSIISLAFRLNNGAIKRLPKTRDEYMVEFTYGNTHLYRLAQQVTRYIEDKGYESIGFTPDLASAVTIKADISHKHAAVACGLGKFGLNELLVTPKYKSSVRLVTVITEAAFDVYDELLSNNPCDHCGKCISVCPAKALGKWEGEFSPEIGYTIEKQRCSYYQKTVLGGKRCGMCIKACLSC